MPKPSEKPPAPVTPPARPVPWPWLVAAVAGGGLLGWAAANVHSFRSAPAPAAPIASPSAAVTPKLTPPLPAVPAITPAQSNAIFSLTNRVVQANTNPAAGDVTASPKPPPLLTAQTPPPVPAALPPRQGETLYNGIILPEVWPPKDAYKAGEPMPVPYLSTPPPVIDISNGRQLFVDDFLIDQTTLKRVWHTATLYSNNPVLRPDQAWEQTGGAMAMPFSDGVWLDPWCMLTPPQFKPEEIQDVPAMVERLKNPGTNNALGQFLEARLSPEARAKLAEFKPVDLASLQAMQKLLAKELNAIVTGPAIYTEERFGELNRSRRLQDRTLQLLALRPPSEGDLLARLNRWLLEDAFPRELFKMQPVFTCHYMAGYGRGTALAISTNGRDWEKPKFDVQPGTGLVQTDPRDSSTVWLDQDDPDPKRRYKMWRSHSEGGTFGLSLHFSPDGVHWGPRVLRTGSAGDRTTVFYNPFRKVWVYSLRHGWGEPRARRYWEVKDLLIGPHWKAITEPPMWVGSDRLDPMRADLQVTPQLYNLDAVAYESLMVGLFTIWRGDKNLPEGRPKPNSVWLGFSRDGYHWDRPVRQPLIDVSEKKGDWNWGNVQSVAGGFQVAGRNLNFYFSGRAGVEGKRDGGGAMGLTPLRRDGFASMDAGPEGGVLTTRPVRVNGRFMFLNMKTNAPGGEVRVEIQHADGRPIAVTKNDTKQQLTPFTKELAIPLAADQTLMGVSWQNGIQDLAMLAGRTVRFRFHVTNASLYSFWVSPYQLGRSLGYVAAGGPNFTASTDTIGNRSYNAFPLELRPLTAPAAPAPAAPTNAPAPAKPPEKK
ncbi:MAG: hypothetical protein ACKODH_10035 [Limisphaerales bacterium]